MAFFGSKIWKPEKFLIFEIRISYIFEMQFFYVFLDRTPVEMERVEKEIVIPNVELYCIVAVYIHKNNLVDRIKARKAFLYGIHSCS